MNEITDFAKGIITGFFISAVIIFGVIYALWFFQKRERTFSPKELIKYVEKQIEIEAVREDYRNRDPVEFIDDIPGVRRAVDHATAEFDRKRDEALQRIRNRPFD
jgi:hypothetical protein